MAQSDSDQKKQEKLFNFLCKALDDYDKGERKNLNLIQDEVCQKNKDINYLKMWMNCFSQKVFQQQQQQNTNQQVLQQHKKFVIELVLFKMPFLDFDTDHTQHNHLDILNLLERFIMQLISQKQQQYTIPVFQHLIDNITPLVLNDLHAFEKLNEQTIQVGNQEFQGKQNLISHIKQIIAKYPVYSLSDTCELSQEDQEFMIALFKNHPNGYKKMQDMQKVCIGKKMFGSKSQQLFFIEKTNKEREDISYMKSVTNIFEDKFLKNQINFKNEKFQKINDFIVNILSKILKIYPLQQKQFLEIAEEKYPHKVKNEECHKIYLMTLLKIAQKQPNILPRISKIIIRKLIEIDAEIKLDSNQILSDSNLTQEQKMNFIDQMARKLDWLMLIYFEYMSVHFGDPQQNLNNLFFQSKNVKALTQKEQEKQFKSLLEIFNNEILITHESKYVQFILYKICSFNYEYCEQFMSMLIKNIVLKTETVYMQTKINSTFYLMSFIARASFLESETIWKSLLIIMQYIRDYIDSNKDRYQQISERDELIKEHSMLYYNLQMIIYIILYRHKHMNEENVQAIFDFLEEVLENSFQSQNFIQYKVLQQFSNLLKTKYPQRTSLLEILQSHKTNSNNYQNQKKISHNESENSQLYLYYPFDPYLLQYSEKYIKYIYLCWNDVTFEYEEMEVNNTNGQSPNSTTHSDPPNIEDIYQNVQDLDNNNNQIDSSNEQDLSESNCEESNDEALILKSNNINVKRKSSDIFKRKKSVDSLNTIQSKKNKQKHIKKKSSQTIISQSGDSIEQLDLQYHSQKKVKLNNIQNYSNNNKKITTNN